MLPEQIKTIKNFQTSSLKEKGSEFLAIVYPIDNEESALDRLNEIKKNIMMQLIIATPIN
ncbi:MAG: hypothetical protein ABI638_15680 [Ignavibacteriota bacterium]